MMEEKLLETINHELKEILKLNYEYGEYTGELIYPYGVGEYNETNYSFELNQTEGELLLSFWNRGSELELVEIKEKIKNHFKDFRSETINGTVFVTYKTKLFVRTGEEDLKRIDLYLDTRYWEGDKL